MLEYVAGSWLAITLGRNCIIDNRIMDKQVHRWVLWNHGSIPSLAAWSRKTRKRNKV